MMKANLINGLCLLLALSGCQLSRCSSIDPSICYTPPQRVIEKLPSPFLPLNPIERPQDWGKELFLGQAFAREMDLYRALTCFKRALLLIPREMIERRLEIEYDIFLAYYLGNKYFEAIEIFETGRLMEAPTHFPALRELLIALYDAYIKTDQLDRACSVLNLINSIEESTAASLQTSTAIMEADFPCMLHNAENTLHYEAVSSLASDYLSQAKSASKARTLNAILPGAGYYYVGQKKTALTSFLINALFIAAAYQLFDRGYIPAAIIVTSLEMGWYFGGINGAGLAVKEYNEHLYNTLGKELMIQQRLFPVLMLQKSF